MAVAGIVLVGGRSTRMGEDKAWLDWDGQPLVRRTSDLLADCLDGPVVVVRAAGQDLPALARGVDVVDDREPGLGPLAGLASGLAAVGPHVEAALVCATDLPFLHPAVARAVAAALLTPVEPADRPWEAAVPVVGGTWQPLLAAYRSSLAKAVEESVAAGRLSVRDFVAGRRVRLVDEQQLRAVDDVAAGDADLASFVNVNERQDLARARAARRG